MISISTRKTIFSSLTVLAIGLGAAAALTPALADTEGNRANKPGPNAYTQIMQYMETLGFSHDCMAMRHVYDRRGRSLGNAVITTC